MYNQIVQEITIKIKKKFKKKKKKNLEHEININKTFEIKQERVRKYNTCSFIVVWSNSTYPTPQAPLENLNKLFSTLSSDQSSTATLLFLRVQEQTQSLPWLRIKSVHRCFYEFKSKLNSLHGSGSNWYTTISSLRMFD